MKPTPGDPPGRFPEPLANRAALAALQRVTDRITHALRGEDGPRVLPG